MSHIFISYSRKDLTIAEKIINALAKDDLEPWIDWKSIPKGETFEGEIYQGIEKAEVFLFLVSPDSVQSDWCNKEIAHAVLNGKRILPIVIRDTDPKIIHPEISKRNWIFCHDGQDGFNKAIEETRKTIHTDYEWLKYHTELQVKALKWEQKKDNSRLLRGKELREAEKQLAEISNQEDPQPTKMQREYILASQRDEVHARRQVTMGLVFGLVVVATLAVFAWVQRNTAVAKEKARATAQAEAEEQANIALSKQLSLQSQILLDEEHGDPLISTLLALESYKRTPSLEALFSLRQSWSYLLLANEIFNVQQEGSVHAIIFSHNGKWLFSGGHKGDVIINDVITGKELKRISTGADIGAIALSGDDKMLVVELDKSICSWDTSTWRMIVCKQDETYLDNAIITLDGKRIISSNGNGLVSVWNPYNGHEYVSFLHNSDSNAVLSIDINKSQDLLVSGDRSGLIRIWDLYTGKQLIQINQGGEVTKVVFSPDGKRIASIGDDDAIRIWDVSTGQHLLDMFHDDKVLSIAFSPDGNKLVSGSADDSIRIWDSLSGKEIKRMNSYYVETILYSPNGKFIVSGSVDDTARVWDANSGAELTRLTHNNNAIEIAISPNGQLIASGESQLNYDGIVRIWKTLPRDLGKVTIYEDGESDWSVSDDGRWLVLGKLDGVVALYDTLNGLEFFRSKPLKTAIVTVVLSPDKSLVAAGGDDGSVIVWDTSTMSQIAKIEHNDSIQVVAFNHDGTKIASGSRDGILVIWDPRSGQEFVQRNIEDQGDNDFRKIIFSPDGKIIYVKLWNRIIVLDSQTGVIKNKIVGGVDIKGGAEDMALSPDGKWLGVATSPINGFFLWSTNSWKQIYEVELKASYDVMFSSDSSLVILASSKDVRVLDVASGKDKTSLYYNNPVEAIALSETNGWIVSHNNVSYGQYIVSNARKDEIVFWLWKSDDIANDACEHLSRNLTHSEWIQYVGEKNPYHVTCPNLPVPTE